MLPTGYIPEYYRDARDIVFNAELASSASHTGLLARLLAFLRAPRAVTSSDHPIDEPAADRSLSEIQALG